MRRALVATAGCLILAACHQASPSDARSASATADSLVLERSRCFGFCPAYRMSLRADGRVTFTSRVPRDSSRTDTGAISPSQFAWLVQRAARIGLAKLPPVIAEDSTLCPVRATDHPTVIVSLFRADSATRVVDYRGCYAAPDLSVAAPLGQLRHFEAQVDSVARSERWTERMSRP